MKIDGKSIAKGQDYSWKDARSKQMKLVHNGSSIELYTGEQSKVGDKMQPDRISIRVVPNPTGNYIDVDPSGCFHSPPNASLLGWIMKQRTATGIKGENFNLKTLRAPAVPQSAK